MLEKYYLFLLLNHLAQKDINDLSISLDFNV